MAWPGFIWLRRVEYHFGRIAPDIQQAVLRLVVGEQLHDTQSAVRDAVAVLHDSELARYQAYAGAAAAAAVAGIGALVEGIINQDPTWLVEAFSLAILTMLCGRSSDDSWQLATRLRDSAPNAQQFASLFP
jgi:hypothetical protein